MLQIYTDDESNVCIRTLRTQSSSGVVIRNNRPRGSFLSHETQPRVQRNLLAQRFFGRSEMGNRRLPTNLGGQAAQLSTSTWSASTL